MSLTRAIGLILTPKNTAAIICTRYFSRRLPAKAFIEIEGRTVLEHLLFRLGEAGIPAIVAAPLSEKEHYSHLEEFGHTVFYGDLDPLKRMSEAAKEFKVKTVVRITHDKFLLDYDLLKTAINKLEGGEADYIYSSHLPAGASFEVIDSSLVHKASEKHKLVEHISYAVRIFSKKSLDIKPNIPYKTDARFLIDYPEDIRFMSFLLGSVGRDANLGACVQHVDQHKYLKELNHLPEITVYTCVYNNDEYIERAMESVVSQSLYPSCEYIVIDDSSGDKTTSKVARFSSENYRISIFRNPKNLGLASSSNIALKHAKGKFIVRLDGDDYFATQYALQYLLEKAKRGYDAVYPANYYGSDLIIQPGHKEHHIGGAMFSTRAINHIKFTDGLRGFEGLDFWQRAKDQLKVGYLKAPIFMYTQRPGSLSKVDLAMRGKLKRSILEGTLGSQV